MSFVTIVWPLTVWYQNVQVYLHVDTVTADLTLYYTNSTQTLIHKVTINPLRQTIQSNHHQTRTHNIIFIIFLFFIFKF